MGSHPASGFIHVFQGRGIPMSSLVASVQSFLASSGFNPGPVDGIDGPLTEAAWQRFLNSQTKVTSAPGTVIYSGSGRATIFGLNYDGNPDPEDNGEGFFEYNTSTTSLHGVALPVATLDSVLGAFNGSVARLGASIVEHAPGRYINDLIRQKIKAKDFVVSVTNKDGVTDPNCPIVDIGPAQHTGNDIDLTYATAHALSTGGDAQVTFSIIRRS
jgi:peptidoglycan hydrolase-like protein with peptidoglycan-binding domain